MTDVLHCANGAFFPERSVTIGKPEGKPPFQVTVIEVDEFELEPPSNEAFAVELPVCMVVGDGLLNQMSWTRLAAPTRIHLDDLEEWLERGRADEATRTVLPIPDSPSRWPMIVGVATTVAVVLLAGLFYRRFRAHRA